MTALPEEATIMPGTRHEAEPLDVEEATREEGMAILDRVAREKLRISGEEFLRRWDNGDYENTDEPAVVDVAMLIPFAR